MADKIRTDVLIVIALLGIIAAMSVFGIFFLANGSRPASETLNAIAAASVGALSSLLASTSSARRASDTEHRP